MSKDKAESLRSISETLEGERILTPRTRQIDHDIAQRRKDLKIARYSGASEEEIALQIILTSNNLNRENYD